MMEIDSIECYYCRLVTDNLQKCINHVAEAHMENIEGEGCWFGRKSGAVGMNKKTLDSFQKTFYNQDST